MKKKYLGILLATVTLTASGLAFAGSWTAWFTINFMDNEHGDRDGFLVRPDGGTIANPANCSSSSYYEPSPGAGAASRELMSKTLLSAMLAGKRVRLLLSQNACGETNNPYYYAVRVDKDE